MSEDQSFMVKFPDKTSGPFSKPQLQKLIARGRLTEETLVSTDGIEWQAALLLELDFSASSELASPAVQQAYCPQCQASISATATACSECGHEFTEAEDDSSPLSDFMTAVGEASRDEKGSVFFRWLNLACVAVGFAGAAGVLAWLIVISDHLLEQATTPKKLAILIVSPVFCFAICYFTSALLVFGMAPSSIWNHRLGRMWMKVFGTQNVLFARVLCWIHIALLAAIVSGVAFLFSGGAE